MLIGSAIKKRFLILIMFVFICNYTLITISFISFSLPVIVLDEVPAGLPTLGFGVLVAVGVRLDLFLEPFGLPRFGLGVSWMTSPLGPNSGLKKIFFTTLLRLMELFVYS